MAAQVRFSLDTFIGEDVDGPPIGGRDVCQSDRLEEHSALVNVGKLCAREVATKGMHKELVADLLHLWFGEGVIKTHPKGHARLP